ncbi:MAG: Asp23/Gls24 family envelope stress response protein [Candidatus Omnitrophica bacterium]|nr:Asp23/Gls24 family envelope stress response protein [Candidatus Omnitrophota bacterium]
MKVRDQVDLGIVKVNKRFLSELAYAVIQEIDGVVVADGSVRQKFQAFFLGMPHPAIEVVEDEPGEISLNIDVNVRLGLNITDVARLVQDAVRTMIHKTVDLKARDVNVTIQGVIAKILT